MPTTPHTADAPISSESVRISRPAINAQMPPQTAIAMVIPSHENSASLMYERRMTPSAPAANAAVAATMRMA